MQASGPLPAAPTLAIVFLHLYHSPPPNSLVYLLCTAEAPGKMALSWGVGLLCSPNLKQTPCYTFSKDPILSHTLRN